MVAENKYLCYAYIVYCGVQNYLNIFLLIGIILHNLRFWLGPVNLGFKYADRAQPKSYIRGYQI
jgi:hypothetical protein